MHRRVLFIGGATILTVVCVASVSIPPVRTVGQSMWRRSLESDSVPQSIAEAEAHGARHARSRDSAVFPPAVIARPYIGTGERRCVEVGVASVVRAGDVMASPLALYARDWHAGIRPPGKLSWFGGHARSGVPIQLIVRATPLDSAGSSYVWIGPERRLSWGFAKVLRHGWHDATTFDLPRSGRWLLVATLDQDWGCFVYSL